MAPLRNSPTPTMLQKHRKPNVHLERIIIYHCERTRSTPLRPRFLMKRLKTNALQAYCPFNLKFFSNCSKFWYMYLHIALEKGKHFLRFILLYNSIPEQNQVYSLR